MAADSPNPVAVMNAMSRLFDEAGVDQAALACGYAAIRSSYGDWPALQALIFNHSIACARLRSLDRRQATSVDHD